MSPPPLTTGHVRGVDSTAAVTPSKSKKSSGKPKKSKWDTLPRIFAKNFVLLGLIVWWFTFKSNKSDDRILKLEGLLKKIQVQEDVVDKKIVNEVGELRKEIEVKIEQKGAFLENELRKLERYLSELKVDDLLTKEEFEKFVEGLKNVKGNEHEGGGLDEIREFARGVVKSEIEKHAADGLGRVDYALANGGAAVEVHSMPYDKAHWYKFRWTSKSSVHPKANMMLKPSFGEPWQCFPLWGSSGYVQIRLNAEIIPEAITLEHVAKSVAYDRSDAPKDCRISGWLQGGNTDSNRFLLAEFRYDLEKSNAQTFNVLTSAVSGVINTINFEFTSNHGSPSHTCIYRLRVHGYQSDSVSMMAIQP